MALSLPDALVLLGRRLQESSYRFTTVTPASHARVHAREGSRRAANLRDVFGWSRSFSASLLSVDVLATLRESGLLDESGELLRSKVRFSTLDGQLYAHSAYPTFEDDAVFFGPDTYRFASFIHAELARQPLPPGPRILDMGCGAGPGGVSAALASQALQPELLLADINPKALEFARANAALAGLRGAQFQQSDLFASIEGEFDLVVANPPYLVDASERTYRHGGGLLGSRLSLRIVRESLTRLAPGGRLLLYTGAPIVYGEDPFHHDVAPLLHQAGCAFSYREIDPDVFGEELETPAYASADRIAAVGLVVFQADRPGP